MPSVLVAPVTTIRVGKRHRYTSIDRDTLNDGRLSFRARGALAWLLDKPDDWRTNADSMASAGREGREAIRSVLKELETAGYLERNKWRDPETGQWRSEWIVRERPERVSGDGLPALDNRRRVPGPQVLKTETETNEATRSGDPGCPRCHGGGELARGGFYGPCTCIDQRPVVAADLPDYAPIA